MVPSGDVFEIEDLRVLEILNNQTRLRIFRHLEEPKTVRQVADVLAVPVTRLYYHFGLLEEVGVIKVVETRKAGAILQKVYQCVAGTFRPSPNLFRESDDLSRVARVSADVVLDGARIDAEQGLLHHFEAMIEGKDKAEKYPGTISRSVRSLTRDEAAQFSAELEALVSKWGGQADDLDREGVDDYTLTIVFFPLANKGRDV